MDTTSIVREIIKTTEFQRLKKITLGGFNVFLDENNPLYRKGEITVYEHSLGVYEILTRFNASFEERIMGLLHDISRPAFGHIVDYIFGDKEKQEWHESIIEEFVEMSSVSSILEKYGLDYKKMLRKFRKGEYKYLDVPIPDICADRLDYSLRHIRALLNKNLFWILDHIEPREIFEFINENAALEYSLAYLELSKEHYIGKSVVLFEVISKVLKIALEKGIIDLWDFLTKGEEEIYSILAEDKELKEFLNMIKYIKVEESKNDYDLIIKTKCRYIDPLVNGKRLSEIRKDFKNSLELFLSKCNKGLKVKVEPKRLLEELCIL